MSSLPTALGKYQIIREIARSNDIVYEAYDPVMNRRVAIKELATVGGTNAQQKEDRIKRFLREAKAAGSLAHPNIVTIYEVSQESDRYFLAMEFLDGHTLRNEIDTNGFLPIPKAVEVACAILEALSYAHKHGVIHRDIKPDNIQLLSDGRIKLTDFGIARLTFEPNITMDGQIFGTPSYMSPEQVVGREIDLRSDLFSVAVVLYEMLAGAKPFTGDSVVSITYAIMNKEPAPIATIPYTLQRFLERALDKSPGQRYTSAEEMAAALRQAAEPQDVFAPAQAATPMVTPYGTPMPQVTPPPPVVYPYDPYAQPQPIAGLPTVPPGMLQVPVYYPPPPRQPLLKPETKMFLGRLFVTFVVLGTLFTLVLVGVNAMGRVVQRMQAKEQDQVIRQLFMTDDPSTLEKRITDYEAYRAKQTDPELLALDNRNLAVLYEQLGKVAIQRNDYPLAESCFKRAIELDAENPAFASDLGRLYAMTAETARGPQRIQMLQESANNWERAVRTEPNVSKRQSYASGAAQTWFSYAEEVALFDPAGAREKLYRAREFAPPSSEIALQIEALIQTLTR